MRAFQKPRGDAAKLAQPRPVPAEDRAQQPRDGEHVLAVRHGLENVLLDPLAIEQHALPVVRVAALDEAFEDLSFDRAPQPARIP